MFFVFFCFLFLIFYYLKKMLKEKKLNIGVADMIGGVLPVGVLRTLNLKLLGLEPFTTSVLGRLNGTNPEVADSVSSAKKSLSEGRGTLLLCAVIRDKSSPHDMQPNRNMMLYPQNGGIRHLSVYEISAGDGRGEPRTEVRKKIETCEAFRVEHVDKIFPGCIFRFFPQEFRNWMHILIMPPVV
jgi:hypothetical protein